MSGTIIVACGNPLRHDDAVGARVVELLGTIANVTYRIEHQLAPEMAADLADADTVVFVDAAIDARTVRIEHVERGATHAALTHSAAPREITALAQALYDSAADAYVCSVPAEDFSPGEGLSARGAVSARIAARALKRFLRERG